MTSDTTLTSTRDDELGSRLRELDVPEHQAAFYTELRGLLAAERPARARGNRRRRAVRIAAVAAIAVAVVIAGAIGIPRLGGDGSRVSGPPAANAAMVKAHLRLALGAMRNLSGVLSSSGPASSDHARWRFTIDDQGDARLEGPGKGEAITYDAATGVARSAQHSASMGGAALFYAERSGVAPGPPDQGPPTWIIPEQFAAYVRAALAASDPAVRSVTYEGSPAWRLDVAAVPNTLVPELSGDAFQITVDAGTWMPVRVVELKHGSVLRELRITHLAVDRTLPAGTFQLAFPVGADVARSDDGFRRVALTAAATSAGYAPLVPASVPDGYHLAEVAVARDAAPAGSNPRSRMVVSLSYRRGLDQFVVTSRLRGTATWSDPLSTGPGAVDAAEGVTIAAGALSGIAAQLVLVPRGVPHLWAQWGDQVVTVAGDLGRAELLDVAASLTAHP
jgi:hypothetical protein